MKSSPPASIATGNSGPLEPSGANGRSADSLLMRLVRTALLLGLAAVVTFLLALAVLAWSETLTKRIATGEPVAWSVTLGCMALLAVVLVAIATRTRLRSWSWILGGYLAVAPMLTYLAIDDPIVLHSTTMDEIAPAFPGAEKSYAVLMRYSKQNPSEEARAFAHGRLRILGMPVNPDRRDEWIAFLKANRAAIEADWAQLEPQRRWLAELNGFDRIGDLGEATPDADIISFPVWRLLTQRTLHVAGLQVLDGKPDDAVETLLPMLHAGRKLQPSARSLVRFMVALVVERTFVLYVLNLLDQETLRPETKAKLAATLAGGVRGEAGARRLVGIEYAFIVSNYFEKPLGEVLAGGVSQSPVKPGLRPLLNLISPFVYNPRRTMNLMSELNRELQDLAARRELMSEHAARLYAEKTRPRFKNLVGPILADMTTPAYSKVVRSYWELHDAREKLVAKLAPTT